MIPVLALNQSKNSYQQMRRWKTWKYWYRWIMGRWRRVSWDTISRHWAIKRQNCETYFRFPKIKTGSLRQFMKWKWLRKDNSIKSPILSSDSKVQPKEIRCSLEEFSQPSCSYCYSCSGQRLHLMINSHDISS